MTKMNSMASGETAENGQLIHSIDTFVERASQLYSLPAVALEVLDLVDRPKLDATALKQCIERDPALVAKVLRVVNSSVFGMSRRVENLTQAIALLGFRPLKLLVLGFSLPPQLAQSLSSEALATHWRTGLTRAVAARQLARDYFDLEPDDAFIAALLCDLGKLVLLGQLGEAYAEMLVEARDNQIDIATETRAAIGFDHYQLTAALLRHWKLPESICRSVDTLSQRTGSVPEFSSRDPLERTVILADLVADVVEGHSLAALPRLHTLANAWASIDHDSIKRLIATIDEQRNQFADAFQIDLPSGEDNGSVLVEAYDKLSQAVERALGESAADDADFQDRWEEFRTRLSQVGSQLHNRNDLVAAPETVAAPRAAHGDVKSRLQRDLAQAVIRCRSQRVSLSIMLLHASSTSPSITPARIQAALALMLDEHFGSDQLQVSRWHGTGIVVVIEKHDRHETKAIADDILIDLDRPPKSRSRAAHLEKLSIGIAGVEVVSRSFDSRKLLQGAERCLAAARDCERSAVKSIEVY